MHIYIYIYIYMHIYVHTGTDGSATTRPMGLSLKACQQLGKYVSS